MKDREWGYFCVESDLFDIDTGKDLIYYDLIDGDFPVIGHKAENNGITATTQRLDNYTLYDNNTTIALADRGNFFASVQDKPFYIGTRVKALKAKFQANLNRLLFLCVLINNESYRFSYGRNCCDRISSLKIKLPLNKKREIDWMWIDSYMDKLKDNLPSKAKSIFSNKFDNKTFDARKIAISSWNWFHVKDIFTIIEKCKCSNATELLNKGTDIAYIGAKKKENGVMRYVKYEAGLVTKGNCIVFIGDGQGSVGYCLYQPKDFIGSTTLIAGYNDHLNVYTALFLVSIFDLERYRYSFGRKYNKNAILNSKIKLPVDTSGNPDWQFMEDYIKSLPYSKNIE